MTGRGRRIAVAFLILAGALVGGRWAAAFFAERWWEASVSEAVAIAGARRALLQTAFELALVFITTGWLLLHYELATRIALPHRADPLQPGSLSWPRAVPRWSVAAGAVVVGILLGGGGGRLLDPFLLMLDGAPTGLRDPLLEEDLGTFLGSFAFWSTMQTRAMVLSLVALAGVTAILAAGGLVRRSGRRIRVAPPARGQLAILVAVLGLTLAWGASLGPRELASGARGPLRQSDFLLHAMMAWLQTGIGAATAVVSLLWWVRIRGAVVLLFWVLFGVAWLGGAALPLHPDLATADPVWRNDARRLDSVAYGIPSLEAGGAPKLPDLAGLRATVWDDSMARRAGLGRFAHRGWLPFRAPGQVPIPVWLGFREEGTRPLLLAMSDEQVGNGGSPLFWDGEAPEPSPGIRAYRTLEPERLPIRPGAPRMAILPDLFQAGVPVTNLLRRLTLAWAWQVPGALSAPRAARIGWRLDPLNRLESIAPFAHWSSPRMRWLGARLVWQSDGQLVAKHFPSSQQIPWGSGQVGLFRSAFLGVVDAESGGVRIFRRDSADSLAMAWARITAPLIEAPDAAPAGLRTEESYPEELALAQARVVAGKAWAAGTLEVERSRNLSTESPGGAERVISFLRPGTQLVASLLLCRRTEAGDSLWLIPLDSLAPLESAAALRQRWERFPFEQMLRDSILAAGAAFRTGAVRYALTQDGPIAYQPAWAEAPAARPRLALVNVAVGPNLGTGRRLDEALRNLRGEISPAPVGAASQAILDEVRRWWQRADSAFQRGDLVALGRALAQLRELLERQP